MPFFRRLRPDHNGKERSKSSISPGPSKSPGDPDFPRSPGAGLSKAKRNSDYVYQCVGCNHVDSMIRRNVEPEDGGLSKVANVLLHDSFEELAECALTCETCRVFRQSLILEAVTFEDVRCLQETKGSISVHWHERQAVHEAHKAYLTVKVLDRDETGVVICSRHNDTSHLGLKVNSLDPGVIKQAQSWLDNCLLNHMGECDNLNWNDETPELLIEICSDSTIRLRENHRSREKYVALSYCWGNSEQYTPLEKARVESGTTRYRNLKRRMEEFSMDELPATVADTLKFLYALGIQYAWIDTLCINQDTKKGVETMHKVYSNALLTVCACATIRATDRLLDKRQAWTDFIKPCRLGERWLTTADMSLNEVRQRSPLAQRAWTLQEERLSPRILYITSNRIYWSCSQSHDMELTARRKEKSHTVARPVYAATDRYNALPQSQRFLQACYGGELNNLPSLWNDIILSYALRDMGKKSDRLTAVSGLAAKYLRAAKQDQYMAGLWKNNLAQGLSWRVRTAVLFDHDLERWPSWSWAILPPQTAFDIDETSAPSVIFHEVDTGNKMIVLQDNSVGDAIIDGQNVREILVVGNVRTLWQPFSRAVNWSAVSVHGKERFTFTINSQQDMHAIDGNSGRIVVYEDQKRAVVGQIDFHETVERLQKDLLDLWALEIRATTMLILQHYGGGVCRRVGIAWDVREDFFAQADVRSLTLQ